MSRATEYRLIKTDPDFPKLVKIGPQLHAYTEDSVERYAEILLARADSGEPRQDQ